MYFIKITLTQLLKNKINFNEINVKKFFSLTDLVLLMYLDLT